MAYHPPPTSLTPLPNVVVPYVLLPPKMAPQPVLPLISAEHVLLPIVPVWYAVRSWLQFSWICSDATLFSEG